MAPIDPEAWLQPMPKADFTHPRWQKYKETGDLLSDLFKSITEFKLPPSMPSFFGDGGARTVTNAATAIWLCKNASTLFKEVADRLQKNGDPRYLQTLTPAIVEILNVEMSSLPNKTQVDLLARLMVSLGVGMLPANTDWSHRLRDLIELQFESTSGSGYERPIMRWAIGIELDHPDMPLKQREKSLRDHIKKEQSRLDGWDLNNWAYLLLRLELYHSAAPMAKIAMETSEWAGSLDSYGWALFYEKDYKKAAGFLLKAVGLLSQGSADWCEVQYHRLQTAFWSGNLTDARLIIDELHNEAPKNYWTVRAVEIKPLLIARTSAIKTKKKGKYQYDVALSFAGENRREADQLARSLTEQGVTVFYDDFARAALWGQDLYQYLTTLYQKKAKYCVMLISKYYLLKRWTNLECRAAQARAFEENNPYILPIRFDDTEIPGVLPTMGYMSWQKDGLHLIVQTLIEKLQTN